MSLLCPELIGRAAEVASLRERVDAMAAGRGGVVALVAGAGAGKTRLAVATAEAAAARGCPVLTGRAVPGPNAVPYRALVEAFLGAFRSAPVPDSPALAGLGGHLGRLVPGWRGDRTSRPPRTRRSCWPRPSCGSCAPTATGGAACSWWRTCTGPTRRPWPPSTTWATRCRPSRCCAWRPRGPRATPRSCSNGWRAATPPRSSASGRWPRTTSTGWWRPASPRRARPPGSPASCAPTATARRSSSRSCSRASSRRARCGVRTGSWVAAGELTPRVPASLRESIARRTGMLDATARRVIGAAAMLGRRFDWELLPGIADVDGRAVVDGAAGRRRRAARGGGRRPLRLPPRAHPRGRAGRPAPARATRSSPSGRGPRSNGRIPACPGTTCELAAELAEAAGAPAQAAERLVESARRALAAGALATAEATARRARGSPRRRSRRRPRPTRCSCGCWSPRASPSRRASSASPSSPGWPRPSARTCWSAWPTPP